MIFPTFRRQFFVLPTTVLLLAACGGGGSGVDRQPPVVTLNAPSQTVEAGQTVTLMASAFDAKDGERPVALTCSDGTLSGTALTTPEVQAAQTITCTATASDADGNIVQTTVTLEVEPRAPTLTVEQMSEQALTSGSMGLLSANGMALDQETYEGTLAGIPLTLVRTPDGQGLAYVVPMGIPAGSYKLATTIGTKKFDVEIALNKAPVILEPQTFVRDALENILIDASVLLESPDSDVGLVAQQQLTNARAQISSTLASLDTMNDDELNTLATFLMTNGIATDVAPLNAFGRTRALFQSNECERALKAYYYWVGFAVAEIGLTAAGVYLAPLGLIVSAALVIDLRKTVKNSLTPAATKVAELCVDTAANKIIDAFSTANSFYIPRYRTLNTQTTALSFSNSKPKSIIIESKKSIVTTAISKVRAAAERAVASLSSIGINSQVLTHLLKLSSEGIIENIPASSISLSNISDARIIGSTKTSGDQLTLTFSAPDNVTEEKLYFYFQLTPSDHQPINVSATLSKILPQIQSGSIATRQNQYVASQLQVTNVDRLEVITAPSKGTLLLNNDGSFVYTPNRSAFGADGFTYRGINQDGESKPEAVAIQINRQFEGTWLLQSTARTTSESTPGLCPDQENTFSIVIAKATDTRYTTSYQGIGFELTMASANDPSGLRASKSVSYPDDPGTTSESISISIPDSDTLTGSGAFNYQGPGGSFCSGVTTVTGTR